MAGLGDMVGNAVNAYGGGSTGTSLQTFLDKFSNTAGRYVDTIDPLGLFDVQFHFHPGDKPHEIKDDDALKRVGNSLLNSAKKMGTAALDNITGGIFSSAMAGSVKDDRENFEYYENHSFLEYLVPAHLLESGEQWMSDEQKASPLILNLGHYVQKITGIQMQMGGEDKTSSNLFGEFPVNGTHLKPSGELQMDIINTKASLHERIFYPWMRECVNPWWAYDTAPYTTATVIVDFTKHNDVKYVFTGVRPKQISLLNGEQSGTDSSNLTRNVTFMYDFMFITSDMKVIDDWKSKLMGSAGALVAGAGQMMNLGRQGN